MKCKFLPFIGVMLFCLSGVYAQVGIKAGINMATEILSFQQSGAGDGFTTSNLTGFQFGLIYQAMPANSGVGIETGVLLSQKGSTFNDSSNAAGVIKQGYKELTFLEVPLNIRYHLLFGSVGLYGFGGLYGGYSLSNKTVDESTNNSQSGTYPGFMDHIDYGVHVGAGFEFFRKVQFGATFSQGLKNMTLNTPALPTPAKALNRVFSIDLVYLF